MPRRAGCRNGSRAAGIAAGELVAHGAQLLLQACHLIRLAGQLTLEQRGSLAQRGLDGQAAVELVSAGVTQLLNLQSATLSGMRLGDLQNQVQI